MLETMLEQHYRIVVFPTFPQPVIPNYYGNYNECRATQLPPTSSETFSQTLENRIMVSCRKNIYRQEPRKTHTIIVKTVTFSALRMVKNGINLNGFFLHNVRSGVSLVVEFILP